MSKLMWTRALVKVPKKQKKEKKKGEYKKCCSTFNNLRVSKAR